MKPREFEFLVDALKALPSISSKSADRIAHFLLNSDDDFYNKFIERIITAKNKIKFCIHCNNLTSESFTCEICKNIDRHNRKICIVTSVDDLYKIESSNSFFGTYFVLKNELDYKNKKSIDFLDMSLLEKTINMFKVNEVLIATNMTTNGELTSSYIKNYLQDKKYNLDFYRLAMGIPFNSSIDYIDWESLKYSIKNKVKI